MVLVLRSNAATGSDFWRAFLFELCSMRLLRLIRTAEGARTKTRQNQIHHCLRAITSSIPAKCGRAFFDFFCHHSNDHDKKRYHFEQSKSLHITITLVLLNSMHQHRRFLQVLWIVLLLTISSIQIVSVRGLGGLGNTNMLLRIRTNEGTFQIRGLDETTTKVQELVTAPPMHLYNLLEPGFSLDPMGKQVLLDYDQPLSYYQLQHGSMIYVRVEKKTKGLPAAATTSTTTITRDSDSIDPLSFYNSQVPSVASKPSKPAGSSSTIAAAAASNDGKRKEQPVIDLLDSESDSDNGGDSSGGQQSINLLESSDDDDSVKIVQPTAAPPRTKSKIIKNPYAKPPKTTTTTTTTTNAAKSKPKSAPSSSIASSSHSSLPDTFQVASYNVWFGPPDPTANQVHYAQRMKAIAQALFQCHQQPITNPLLAIGFQELTPSLKQSLFPLLSHQDYQVCSQPS
jgi:hypothetical protein